MVGTPTLTAGIGCRRGTDADRLAQALDGALLDAGRERGDLCRLASWDGKADEAGLAALADRLGLPLALLPADRLALQPVAAPSARVAGKIGLPSVAEAAALLAAGPGACLVRPRFVDGPVVVALAALPPDGKGNADG